MKGFVLAVLLAALSMSCSAHAADPSNSIYHLHARLTNQHGKPHGLDVYRGHPVLVTMFYGGCAATCPLIIDQLRATERALHPTQRAGLRVLLISIDPTGDTPVRLREIATERHIDTARWTLAHADAATVRQIAAVLNVQYRQLPNGQYNHSSAIAVLSPQGEIMARSSSLSRADIATLIAPLQKQASSPAPQLSIPSRKMNSITASRP